MVRRTLCLLVALLLAGCGSDDAGAPEPTAAERTITVTSPAFDDGDAVPAAYTCHGAGTSPELHWSGVPAEAKALALVVDEPDAPSGTFTHWVVVDIPPTTTRVAAGRAPAGGTELRASRDRGWSPPCPPGGTHHYRFHVYALRSPLGLPESASLDEAIKAIDAATLAWGRLTGTVAAPGSGGGGY